MQTQGRPVNAEQRLRELDFLLPRTSFLRYWGACVISWAQHFLVAAPPATNPKLLKTKYVKEGLAETVGECNGPRVDDGSAGRGNEVCSKLLHRALKIILKLSIVYESNLQTPLT